MIPWYAYALISVVLAALFEITRKKALTKVHAMNFESARSLMLVLLLLFLIPFINLNVDNKTIGIVYIVSLLATIGILFFSKALKHNDISLIAPLGNVRPALVAILAYLFLSETLVFKQIIGVIVIFLSAYFLEADHHL